MCIKKSYYLYTLIVFICSLSLSAQDYVTLTFSDTYKNSSQTYKNLPMLPKAMRARCYSPAINISSDNELDDEIYKVADYALPVWESYITNCVNLNVKIELSDSITEDIQTVVKYNIKNEILYPTALKYFLEKPKFRDMTIPDGIIRINKNTQWDYSLGDNLSSNGKNLAFGIMRAMARIMGFGSNVCVNENGEYYFSDKRYHTIFNTLVSNSSEKYLNTLSTNMGKPNAQLKSYIEESGQSFWVNTNNKKYKLASPPYSQDTPPFVYMESDPLNACLMSSDLSIGNHILQIDQTTQEILNSLGWNIQKSYPIKIISKDVSDTGITSAYESHLFSTNLIASTFSSPHWELVLPKSDGEYETITLKDSNYSCETPPILDDTKYKINSDGDIEGQLFFSCLMNGMEIYAMPFKIYFELKPVIESATILDIKDNAPSKSYDAFFKVIYRGADRIEVSVVEEYSPAVFFHYINEPYVAYGVADHIASPYYAWIDFVAENKYGKSTYTIELEPYGVVAQSYSNNKQDKSQKTFNSNICVNNNGDVLEVYNATGLKIGSINDMSDINSLSFKGLLTIKRVNNNRVIENIKTFCK